MEQSISRRGLIGAAIGTGAAAAMTPSLAMAHGRGKGHHDHDHGGGGSVPRNRRSSQLYSWRRVMNNQANAEKMLRALSRMGYTQVERAGTYDWTAQQFKRVLDRYDLWAHSSHDGFSLDVTPATPNKWLDDWKPAVEYANELDQKFIGFAWFPGPYDSKAFWQFLADRFNQAGAYARSQGLQFFYHNHDFEFTNKFDGKPAYDILLNETDSRNVKFELDLYWIVYGGESPVHYLAADPARYPLYHVKDRTWRDRGPTVQDWEDVGPGSIDFPDIFDAGDGRRLDKHFVIEHDQPQLSHPGDESAELKTAAAGIEYLRNVRW